VGEDLKDEQKDRLLSKVDGKKRDTLRKIAIASAYAVPAMATFSLDGVRKKALAQGNYATGEARVINASFTPGATAGFAALPAAAQPAASFFGTLRVNFSKPMATSLNSCKRVTGTVCEEIVTSEIISSKLDILNAGAPSTVDLSDGWVWPDDTTEEKMVLDKVSRITLVYSTPGLCPAGQEYRARDGGPLRPYTGEIDTSLYCPGYIASKIDPL
jgi:hypothetical protein